jgi:hypothetical protein
LEAEFKKAVRRFLLNNLGQMEQAELDQWLAGELDLAPLLEPPLKAMSKYRDQLIRELHQISPGEILDSFVREHPELVFSDKDRTMVRIGRELEAMKAFLITL